MYMCMCTCTCTVNILVHVHLCTYLCTFVSIIIIVRTKLGLSDNIDYHDIFGDRDNHYKNICIAIIPRVSAHVQL